MRTLSLVALLAVAIAGNVNAQASPASIDPGMTKEQVIARLGKPTSERTSGTSTYLYYRNGMEKTVGMSDMVALDDGKVADAVFRSSARKYTGKSSSPAPVSAEAAIAKGNGGRMPARKPLAVPAKKAADAKKATDAKKAPESAKKTAPATAKKTAPATARKP